jgi:multidrug efflux pump subunit AcrA (membrane-fusion protein)
MLKYGVPVAAAMMLITAIAYVVRTYPTQPVAPPPVAPPHSPFPEALAVSGVVEANTGNIAVAPPAPGVVAEVFVRVGQSVPAQAPLFRLDDRSLRAALQMRKARLASARAQQARAEQAPREDEVIASEARVGEARAQLAIQQARLDRGEQMRKDRLISSQEVEQLRQEVKAAREQLKRAEAGNRILRAGARESDRDVARAAVQEAAALVGQAETELARLTVRAPVAATVLQVNAHPGEAAGGTPGAPAILIGNVRPLHVRAEVPEDQTGAFRPEAPARAVCRDGTRRTFPLEFVRVEPLLVARRVFSGDSGERTETRVLQVVYRLDPGPDDVRVGQRLDVFIATGTAAGKPTSSD